MTKAHNVPAVDAPDVDAAIAALRARGMRVSAARRLVLEALYTAGGPLTAEEIASGAVAGTPPSDLASVYRNLEALEQAGLVRHFHLGHGPARYERTAAPQREYLLCDRCAAVVAVEPAQLDGVREAVRRATGFDARFTHFPIAGLCPRCGSAADAGEGR